MKKAISLLGAIIILLSIPAVSIAAQNEYKLPDVGITIVIPDGNYVLTRDISSSDPALTFYGMSKTDCLSFMEERNIYLNAVNSDVTKEIVVTMTENIISDLNLLPNSTIDTMLSSLIDTYSQAGITIDSSDYYQHEQAKFIVFGIHQNGTNGLTYGKQYFTIYNYKAINVTFYSYDGPLSDWDNFINEITISGIKFDTPPQKQEPAAKTEPIKYTDPKTGVSFTVPANWIQEETNKPRETIDVKFESTDYEAMILFGCVDLWSQLTESERAGNKRSNVNLSVITNDEIKEIVSSFGGDVRAYSKETISGTKYIVFDHTSSIGGFSASLKMYFKHAYGLEEMFNHDTSLELISAYFAEEEQIFAYREECKNAGLAFLRHGFEFLHTGRLRKRFGNR